jgi:hypothetical protein
MLLFYWDTRPGKLCAHIIAGILGERERERGRRGINKKK